MKNVVYVEYVRLPTEKAHGYQIMKTCEALQGEKISIRLLIPNRPNPLRDSDPFVYYGVAQNFPIDRLPIPFTFLSINLPVIGRFLFLFQRWMFTRRALAWLKRYAPSATIYTRDYRIARACANRWRVILELHALPSSVEGLSRVAGFVCVTDWIRRRMRDLCPSVPAITIPDSVDLALFDPSITKQEARMALGLDPKERLVVYGGRFSTMGESKGIGMLDHAVHHLAETESTLTLMLVGGSTQEFVTYEKRHPAPTTICVPSVSREQLAKYYRAADWLVMPFPKTHHYAYEMSPLKLFEYMASGTPILTSDLPSVREILTQEMAVFFPPENEEALARALRHAQDPMNQMRLEEMARRAKQRVQAFSWKARAERILSFL